VLGEEAPAGRDQRSAGGGGTIRLRSANNIHTVCL
jgi:hypothetical protein